MKVMIIGAGEVGYHLATRLSSENHDVVVVDSSQPAVARLETLDVQAVLGTGSDPEVLEEAGVGAAEVFVAVTDSDETNIVACLFANSLNPAVAKVARVRTIDPGRFKNIWSSELLNLSLTINPEVEVSKKVLRLLEVPGASDVVDLADGKVGLIGLRVSSGSKMAGLKLAELGGIPLARHFLVAALSRDQKLIIPHGNDRIIAGDLVYLIVTPEHLAEVMSLFGSSLFSLKKVAIVGGGQLGYYLAQTLEKTDASIKIIEKDPDRCAFLVENLKKTMVLKGDGTDQELLQEENIGSTDALVVVTDDEEENVLISLLGRQMGVKQTITRISKSSYLPLANAVGLERVISPRMAAANAILQFIRRGKVLSVAQIKGEEAEVIEFEALETSYLVGTPLAKLKFPKGAIIGALVRDGEMLIPDGETIIQPKDRVVILARREAIPEVEKIRVVKLNHF
jgi:trk system potassium uptake protein TrkA